jgi:hypothetical protein
MEIKFMSIFNKVFSHSNGASTPSRWKPRNRRQASGVLVDMDGTVVLATVAKGDKPGQDLLPLTVDYLERPTPLCIPGSFSSAKPP